MYPPYLIQELCPTYLIQVLSYTPEIFADADVGNPTVATVITGAVNCLVTIIAAPFSDKLGRRFILVGGTTMSGIAYGFLAVSQACYVSEFIKELYSKPFS